MQSAAPKYVEYVLHRLESAGYRAHLVGGCVRDILLGRRPQDWDVCTDARPEAVLALFRKALPTGLKHGTVTVKHGGGHVEVTTWRSESDYSDHRHPDEVRFIPDLEGDLLRRDFTMNAIALDLRGSFTDPFGGREDLARGIIRCVGDADRRYDEDALRMFRALRFAARFGFAIEAESYAAIGRNAALCRHLAPERVRDELEKLICSAHPHYAEDAFRLGLMEVFLPEKSAELSLAVLARLPKNPRVRWAGLCAMLQQEGLIPSADAFLSALRLDNGTIRACTDGVNAALSAPPTDALGWKRLIADRGTEAALCCAAACRVLHGGNPARMLRSVLRSGDCLSLKDLAVSGADLMALGYRGREVGEKLHRLLSAVLENNELNTREALLALAKRP